MAKRNKLFEEALSRVPSERKRQVDLSFDLANLIYDIIKKNNISYSDLAKGLNVSIEEVEYMIGGCYDFTFFDVAKLERILNVKLIEIKYE